MFLLALTSDTSSPAGIPKIVKWLSSFQAQLVELDVPAKYIYCWSDYSRQ